MTWFPQVRQTLAAYYPASQPADIVGYLQGSANPMVWRSMAQGSPARHQMLILGSVPPTQEEWIAAGVAQRQEIQTIRLPALAGLIVLYGGFMLRPWGEIHPASHDALTLGFPAALASWQRNYRPPRR